MAKPVPGNFSVRTRTFLLLPLRLFVGVVLLLQVYEQWDDNWVRGDGLRQAWQSSVGRMFFAPLRDLLTKHALANTEAAGGIIMALEALVGVLLIVGLYVRLASFVGMAITGLQVLVVGVGYRVMVQAEAAAEGAAGSVGQGLQTHMPAFALYGLMFLVLLVFFFTGAGRSFGLDGLIWRRRARRLAKAAEVGPSSEEAPAQ